MLSLTKKKVLCIALALGLILSFFIGCAEASPKDNAVGVLNVKVNPEFAIYYDAAGTVVAVEAVNDDGTEILNGLTDYIGKDCETFTGELIVAIGDAGYLTSEDGTPVEISVTISVLSETEEGTDEIRSPDTKLVETVKQTITDAVTENEWTVALNLTTSGTNSTTAQIQIGVGTGEGEKQSDETSDEEVSDETSEEESSQEEVSETEEEESSKPAETSKAESSKQESSKQPNKEESSKKEEPTVPAKFKPSVNLYNGEEYYEEDFETLLAECIAFYGEENVIVESDSFGKYITTPDASYSQYIPPTVHYCDECGKEQGDGTDGTCMRWMKDKTCPNCGTEVPKHTCHTCP